jgi:hypothetical protein
MLGKLWVFFDIVFGQYEECFNALPRYLSGCGVQPLFAPLVYNVFEELVFSTAMA